jgi:transposase
VTIPRELEVQILRLFSAEHWPVGTIASQLGVHHEVVERVVRQAAVPPTHPLRASMIDPYVGFVCEQWAKYPKLTASRLWGMCRQRGYKGAKDHFRHAVAAFRPKPRTEAFLRLRPLPGEQAQVDWAHFGTVKIGRAERPLVAFVAVLSSSRAIFVRFFAGQQGENFLRGHVEAFERWRGVPRAVLYDNLKTAVLERVGDAIRLNPLLLDFAGCYGFEPRPVGVRRGNEKGRVERAIRYFRGAFFVGRKWRDLPDLNHQADEWCAGEALDRPWPDDTTIKVREALDRERPSLLPLPTDRAPVEERRAAKVGKTPYVRFDKNDYSVPFRLVGKQVVVFASPELVRVVDGVDEVARHARSFDKGQVVEDRAHVEALVEEKRRGHEQRGVDRLVGSVPAIRDLLKLLADRGACLHHATRQLRPLLDAHGARALGAAITEAIEHGAPHVHGVRQILERDRSARGEPPSLPLALPDDPRVRDLEVRTHDLADYDRLGSRGVEVTDE